LVAKVKEKTMANKKSLLGILVMSLVLGFVVVGCSSTKPYIYSDNAHKDFTILGVVTYEAKKGGHQGLIDFLNEAKKQYPGTDYVIDIMVDTKESHFLFSTSYSFVYRGTAIKYK
jgi:hypothetical protein